MQWIARREWACMPLVVAALACGPEHDPMAPRPDAEGLSLVLVGEAAASLGRDGKFILQAPGSDERPELAASEATAYAELVARQYGPMIAGDLEDQHGGPIDFRALRACGSPLFARSPFTAIPTGLSRSAAHYLGSFWIVGLCGAAAQRQVSVAIAANASEITVSRGLLIVPPNSVKMVGIPPTWDAAVPASPEAAAVLAARQAGALVALVPVLVAPNPIAAFPQGAHWVVGLDRPVTLRGAVSNKARQTTAVLVASAEVPANSMRRGPIGLYHELPGGRRVLPFVDFSGAGAAFNLPVLLGTALDIEKVTPVGGGQ